MRIKGWKIHWNLGRSEGFNNTYRRG